VRRPIVTVGITFYNAGRSLAEAIRSVFAQTLEDWELILVDDGSTDGSAALVRGIADPRVKICADGKNLKLAARCNEIAALANGKYVARFDADDVMHPDRLAKQVRFLEANSGIDVLGTGVYVLAESGKAAGKLIPPSSPRLSCDTAHPIFFHPTVTAKREWFLQNPYDASFHRAQDVELWLRTGRTSVFANLQEPLVFYSMFESFSPEKYRLSCRYARQVIRKRGFEAVGAWEARVEILKSFIKPAVFTVAHALGVHQLLIRRRGRTITPGEVAEAEAVLARIRKVVIPGLSWT
jgi:glycosyltransferase involved in cell wall biosynthesis